MYSKSIFLRCGSYLFRQNKLSDLIAVNNVWPSEILIPSAFPGAELGIKYYFSWQFIMGLIVFTLIRREEYVYFYFLHPAELTRPLYFTAVQEQQNYRICARIGLLVIDCMSTSKKNVFRKTFYGLFIGKCHFGPLLLKTVTSFTHFSFCRCLNRSLTLSLCLPVRSLNFSILCSREELVIKFSATSDVFGKSSIWNAGWLCNQIFKTSELAT